MTKVQRRLLLFDIDGTLIHSGGAGVHALKSAFRERFGIADDLHGIEIAGMTDSGIVVSILNKHKFLRRTKTSVRFWTAMCIFFRWNCHAAEANCFPACSSCFRD